MALVTHLYDLDALAYPEPDEADLDVARHTLASVEAHEPASGSAGWSLRATNLRQLDAWLRQAELDIDSAMTENDPNTEPERTEP